MSGSLQPIDFEQALQELHTYIGLQVRANVLLAGHFLAIAFTSRLQRAETLPPDDLALTLHFARGEAIDLDPLETRAFLGRGGEGKARWLELTVDRGRTTLTLEPARGPAAE